MRLPVAVAAALLVTGAPAAAATDSVRVATAPLIAGPVLAGPDVVWGEARDVRADSVKTLIVRAGEPGKRARTVYRSSLPVRSRYDSQLFAELDASQSVLAVVLNLSEACCGPVFRVRGALLGRPFRRLSTTEGPGWIDVDGTRVAFAEDAAYTNDPASEGSDGLPPESPCDAPGLPACSTVSVRDLRGADAVAVITAPRGQSLTHVRLAGRYVAWIRSGTTVDSIVKVWDVEAGREVYSIPSSAWGGEPRGVDLADDGTLAVTTADGRLSYATPAEPFPHGLPGITDAGRLRLFGGRLAFRTPRGALKVVSLASGATRTVVRGRAVGRTAWDYGSGRLTYARKRPGRADFTILLQAA